MDIEVLLQAGKDYREAYDKHMLSAPRHDFEGPVKSKEDVEAYLRELSYYGFGMLRVDHLKEVNAANDNVRMWETLMMELVGEDAPCPVREQIQDLKSMVALQQVKIQRLESQLLVAEKMAEQFHQFEQNLKDGVTEADQRANGYQQEINRLLAVIGKAHAMMLNGFPRAARILLGRELPEFREHPDYQQPKKNPDAEK